MEPGASLQAIEALYRSRYRTFLRTAIAVADSREGGRDAVHDAFVAVVRKRHAFRAEGTLEAWVWPIIIRAALKRRRQENDQSVADAVSDFVWTDALPHEQHREVRGAIATLPERQRLMLFLRYYGDLDYQTIAEATCVRVGTVGAELHAAQARLRRYLEEAVA